jgi:hypothetical protein
MDQYKQHSAGQLRSEGYGLGGGYADAVPNQLRAKEGKLDELGKAIEQITKSTVEQGEQLRRLHMQLLGNFEDAFVPQPSPPPPPGQIGSLQVMLQGLYAEVRRNGQSINALSEL